MPTVLLVRHGRSSANAGGTLAGRTPGVTLDDTGVAQAKALAGRLKNLPLHAIVSSPLERCVRTAEAIAKEGGTRAVPRPEVRLDDGLAECDYGEWTGQSLKELKTHKLWPVVQARPSGITFPGGESMRHMQYRALEAVRSIDDQIEAEHGPDALWVAVSHGDLIKSVLADALGLHLDLFQRLIVDPCSVSIVRYTPLRPFVARLNDTGEVDSLTPPKRRRRYR